MCFYVLLCMGTYGWYSVVLFLCVLNAPFCVALHDFQAVLQARLSSAAAEQVAALARVDVQASVREATAQVIDGLHCWRLPC